MARIKGIAGGQKRVPVAHSIVAQILGCRAPRIAPTVAQMDARIERVATGRATDADFEQLQRDLERCEKVVGPC